MQSSYLKKRGHKFYVQVAVPRPLQKVVGASKIIRTTGESDLRLAERKKHRIIADIRDEIATLVDDDPSSDSWIERQARGIRKAVARGEIDEQIANDLIGVMRDRHLKATGSSPEAALPAERVSRLSALTRLASDPTFTPLSELIASYLAEKKPAVRPSSLGRKERTLGAFLKWLRDDTNPNEVNRRVTGRYVAEVLIGNGRSYKTNADTIVTLSSFWNWMVRRGAYDHANPWEGLSQTVTDQRRGGVKVQPRAWTQAELVRLFKEIPAGGKYCLKELSAIALYTGMRLDEIAELRAGDVNLKRKVIEVREGKTEAAVRTVPVHSVIVPTLKALLKSADGDYLFPTFKPAGRDAKRGHEPSKRFGWWRNRTFPELVHELNGRQKAEVNFHSFRREFVTACEEAGVPETTTQLIVGHTRQSLSYGLYSRGVDLKLLRQAVGKVSFGKVDELVSAGQ